MTGGANGTYCEQLGTPDPANGVAAGYNCYLEPSSTVTISGLDQEPYNKGGGMWCEPETFTGVRSGGGSAPTGFNFTASGTVTSSNLCTRIDTASATISTDSTLSNDFQPVQFEVQGSYIECEPNWVNCAQGSPTVFGVFNFYPGLHIKDTALGSHIENQTITHVAGQFVHLKPESSNGHFDGAIGCTWSMPSYYSSDAVSAYATDDSISSASPTPSTPVPTIPVTDYGPYGDVTWYNTRAEAPAQISVSCGMTDGGPSPITLKAVANLGFETPQPQFSVTYGSVQLLSPWSDGWCNPIPETSLAFGNQCINATPPPGVIWHYSINAGDSAEQGNSAIGLWQIVNSSYYAATFPNSTPTPTTASNCGDGNVPYSGVPSSLGGRGGAQLWNVAGGWYDADAPGTGDITNATTAQLNDTFDDYLMYRPQTGADYQKSIWISLGHLQWGFTSSTQNQGNGLAPPTVTYATPGPASLDTNVATPSFPKKC